MGQLPLRRGSFRDRPGFERGHGQVQFVPFARSGEAGLRRSSRRDLPHALNIIRVLQSCAVICENAVINSSASVDHDCRIGARAFIGPGAILCGGVQVGAGALIGAGAVIPPGLSIGENAVVSAGAVIKRDVKDR